MLTRPIGLFDSGVGGLTVMQEVRRILPGEDVLYYADTARCPYGDQPSQVIQDYAEAATRLLVERGAKLVVVACNTASSAALGTLRSRFAVPIVGMVPALKPASLTTRSKIVGVLATQATVQAQVFADLLSQFAEGVTVLTATCPGLVPLVEQGQVDTPQVFELLRRSVGPLLVAGVDTLVLGCTHFPFLKPALQEIAGPQVEIIDTGEAVARQVERVLRLHDLLNPRPSGGTVTYLCSGDSSAFLEVAGRLLAAVPAAARAIQRP